MLVNKVLKSPTCPYCYSWNTLWDPDIGVTECYECNYVSPMSVSDRRREGWDDGVLAKLIK